ncbi:hypothetical protein [Desulfurobacterium sp.]
MFWIVPPEEEEYWEYEYLRELYFHELEESQKSKSGFSEKFSDEALDEIMEGIFDDEEKGSDEDFIIYTCPACDGTGEVVYFKAQHSASVEPIEVVETCPICNGEGVLYSDELSEEYVKRLEKEYGPLEALDEYENSCSCSHTLDDEDTSIDDIEF